MRLPVGIRIDFTVGVGKVRERIYLPDLNLVFQAVLSTGPCIMEKFRFLPTNWDGLRFAFQ